MKNAYVAMKEIREHLSEATEKHWDDTTILGALIRTHGRIIRSMQMKSPDWFLKRSDALTPSSNRIALPADCAKPVHLEYVSDGTPIEFNITVREKALYKTASNGLPIAPMTGFLLEDYIEITASNFTSQVYLWYERNVPSLHLGTASGGGTNYLELEDDRHKSLVDDHYNGAILEVIDGTGVDTRVEVTDYDGSNQRLTVAGTFDATSVYGLVPVMPEQGWDYLIMYAFYLLLLKPTAVVSDKYFSYVQAEVRYLKKEFDSWVSTNKKTTSRVRYTGAYQHG